MIKSSFRTSSLGHTDDIFKHFSINLQTSEIN